MAHFFNYEDFWCETPYMPDFPYDLESTKEDDPWEIFVYPEYDYSWKDERLWLEEFEKHLEVEEDFWEREYYSRISLTEKTRIWYGYGENWVERHEGKAQIAKHRALRKARKETRSFDRHREIDEAVSNYLELVSWEDIFALWEDIFALEAWLNA